MSDEQRKKSRPSFKNPRSGSWWAHASRPDAGLADGTAASTKKRKRKTGLRGAWLSDSVQGGDANGGLHGAWLSDSTQAEDAGSHNLSLVVAPKSTRSFAFDEEESGDAVPVDASFDIEHWEDLSGEIIDAGEDIQEQLQIQYTQDALVCSVSPIEPNEAFESTAHFLRCQLSTTIHDQNIARVYQLMHLVVRNHFVGINFSGSKLHYFSLKAVSEILRHLKESDVKVLDCSDCSLGDTDYNFSQRAIRMLRVYKSTMSVMIQLVIQLFRMQFRAYFSGLTSKQHATHAMAADQYTSRESHTRLESSGIDLGDETIEPVQQNSVIHESDRLRSHKKPAFITRKNLALALPMLITAALFTDPQLALVLAGLTLLGFTLDIIYFVSKILFAEMRQRYLSSKTPEENAALNTRRLSDLFGGLNQTTISMVCLADNHLSRSDLILISKYFPQSPLVSLDLTGNNFLGYDKSFVTSFLSQAEISKLRYLLLSPCEWLSAKSEILKLVSASNIYPAIHLRDLLSSRSLPQLDAEGVVVYINLFDSRNADLDAYSLLVQAAEAFDIPKRFLHLHVSDHAAFISAVPILRKLAPYVNTLVVDTWNLLTSHHELLDLVVSGVEELYINVPKNRVMITDDVLRYIRSFQTLKSLTITSLKCDETEQLELWATPYIHHCSLRWRSDDSWHSLFVFTASALDNIPSTLLKIQSLQQNATVVFNRTGDFQAACDSMPQVLIEYINVLILDDCRISDGDLARLCLWLQNCHNLTVLSLERNRITRIGLRDIVGILSHLPKLRLLSLTMNHIEVLYQKEMLHSIERDVFAASGDIVPQVNLSGNALVSHKRNKTILKVIVLLLSSSRLSIDVFLQYTFASLKRVKESGDYQLNLWHAGAEETLSIRLSRAQLQLFNQVATIVTDRELVTSHDTFCYLTDELKRRRYELPREFVRQNLSLLDEPQKTIVAKQLLDFHQGAPLKSLLRRRGPLISTTLTQLPSLLFPMHTLTLQHGRVYIFAHKEKEHAMLGYEYLAAYGQRCFYVAHLCVEGGEVFSGGDMRIEFLNRIHHADALSVYHQKYTIVSIEGDKASIKALHQEVSHEANHGVEGHYKLVIMGSKASAQSRSVKAAQNCLKWVLEKLKKFFHIRPNVTLYLPSTVVSEMACMQSLLLETGGTVDVVGNSDCHGGQCADEPSLPPQASPEEKKSGGCVMQ